MGGAETNRREDVRPCTDRKRAKRVDDGGLPSVRCGTMQLQSQVKREIERNPLAIDLTLEDDTPLTTTDESPLDHDSIKRELVCCLLHQRDVETTMENSCTGIAGADGYLEQEHDERR